MTNPNNQVPFSGFQSPFQNMTRENVEQLIVNRLLTTREIIFLNELLLKNIDSSYFPVYWVIYNFIVEYYYKYREIPSPEIVEASFQNFIHTPVKDNVLPLIEELVLRWEYDMSKEIAGKLLENLRNNSREKVIDSIRDWLNKLTISRTSKPESAFISEAKLRKDNYVNTPEDMMFPGIKTGIPPIDETINGIQSSDYIWILARDWVGKTYLNLWFVYLALLQGKKVIYFSPELSSEQLLRRVDLLHNHFNAIAYRKKQLTEDDYQIWDENIESLQQLKNRTWAELYVIDDIPSQSFTLKTMIGRLDKLESRVKQEEKARFPDKAEIIESRKHIFDLMVIDWFHVMKPDNPVAVRKEIWGPYRAISNDIKSFCRIEKVPVILSLHANRWDGDENQAVSTSKNIALSDWVGRDLDVLLSMFQTKEMRDAKIMWISAEKMRDGSPFTAILKWDPLIGSIEFKKTVKNVEEALTALL